MHETQDQSARHPGYGPVYVAMVFGLIAVFFGVVPVFSLAARLWITTGADILMVVTLAAWVVVGRRGSTG